jgi:hypothetical protein
MDILKEFLRDEIQSEEEGLDIINFIESFNIRNGEYEGNRYVLKKIDNLNFFIFPEDIYPDGHKEISGCISIYKTQLLKEIKEWAQSKGIFK